MTEDLQFNGLFGVFDPDPSDDHGPIYLVFPGGFMANCSNDATPGLDAKRLEWIARTLNAALQPSPPPMPAGESVEGEVVPSPEDRFLSRLAAIMELTLCRQSLSERTAELAEATKNVRLIQAERDIAMDWFKAAEAELVAKTIDAERYEQLSRNLSTELAALREEVVKVLEPLRRHYMGLMPETPSTVVVPCTIEFGDLRAARALAEKLKGS